jgi:hypothetical protein
MRFVFASLVIVLGLGCSATNAGTTFGSGGGVTASGSGGGDVINPTGAGGDGAGGGIPTSGGGGGATGVDCSAASELVYVLSEENDLYSFDPPNKKFSKIGHLGCKTSMQPNSMAVDRNAVAWVNYVENDTLNGDTAGTLFKVSTKDASCQPTNMKLGQGWFRLGMGFSAEANGSKAETLFVAGTGDQIGGGSQGLAKIDLASESLVPIGAFTGDLNGMNAELTGTGDARLFGFFTTNPVAVAEVDKGSGAIKSQKDLPQVEVPAAWAFSFWGGDFYLYTAPNAANDPSRTSNVTRYRPADGSVDTGYMTNVGFRIVGAGVSTCAPIAPPK